MPPLYLYLVEIPFSYSAKSGSIVQNFRFGPLACAHLTLLLPHAQRTWQKGQQGSKASSCRNGEVLLANSWETHYKRAPLGVGFDLSHQRLQSRSREHDCSQPVHTENAVEPENAEVTIIRGIMFATTIRWHRRAFA